MNKILDTIRIRNIQEIYELKNITNDGQIELKTKTIVIYKIEPANIVACDEETKYKIYQAYITCIRGLPDAFEVIISKEKADFTKQIDIYNNRIKLVQNKGLKDALKKYIEYLEEVNRINNLYKTNHYLVVQNFNKEQNQEIVNILSNLREFGIRVKRLTAKEVEQVLKKYIAKEV